MTLAHHIDQAIKAYGVMQRDIDYVVRTAKCSSSMSLPVA